MLRRLFVGVALVATSVAMACSNSTSSDVIAPITGVVIRAETVTAGRGCGTTPPQVYKYIALVYGYDGSSDPTDFKKAFRVPVASNVFDCFSDGEFVSIPQTGGSFRYRIELYAYVAPAYQRAAASLDPITGAFTAQNVQDIAASNPTWTTQCEATEQDQVEVLARCDPFTTSEAGGPSVIQVPTSAFTREDGGAIACAPSDGGPPPGDAGDDAADAGDDAALPDEAGTDGGDAGDAGDAGVPPPSRTTFQTVRIRTRIGEQAVGAVQQVACPGTYLLSPAEPLTTYTFDLALLDEKSQLVGLTSCTGAAEPGTVSTATCAPVH